MQNKQNDILEELDNCSSLDMNILPEDISFENILVELEGLEPETEKTHKHTLFNSIMFMTKYVVTSVFIFGILLVTTNYSAYFDIVQSYVYKEKLAIESRGIISSVEASNIKEKFKEQILEEKELIQTENTQKTSDYSVRKLVNLSNKNDISLSIEITPYENRIIIPKIGKNIPLVDIKNKQIEGEDELNNIFMKELENGVIRYPGSSTPGEDGTTFVFGHSSNFPWIKGDYNDVFALLDKVEYDDEILVYYNQTKFRYRIKEKKVITPGDVSVLERNKKKSELTLMTCWPLGTTLNRLIVVGEIIEEEEE